MDSTSLIAHKLFNNSINIQLLVWHQSAAHAISITVSKKVKTFLFQKTDYLVVGIQVKKGKQNWS